MSLAASGSQNALSQIRSRGVTPSENNCRFVDEVVTREIVPEHGKASSQEEIKAKLD